MLSALLGTFTVLVVFFMTVRLFDEWAALWAALMFGLSTSSLNLSQLAVYDALSMPLLALGSYFIITASFHDGDRVTLRLVIAAAIISLSIFTKYIALLYLPALFLGGLTLYLYRKQPVRPLFTVFVYTISLMLLSYYTLYQDALLQVFTGSGHLLFTAGTRSEIINTIVLQAGPLLALTLLGALVVAVSVVRSDHLSWLRRGAVLLVGLLFLVATFFTPLYHIITENVQSFWKHLLYTLLFLVPLAGYGVAEGIGRLRRVNTTWSRGLRLAGVLITVPLIGFVGDRTLQQGWGFQQSWPDLTAGVEFLHDQPLTHDTRILAEQSAVYEYYLDFGAHDNEVWSTTFDFTYGSLEGVDAMSRALYHQYFDYVILDDYYTAATNRLLERLLLAYGYELVYADVSQHLSTGQVVTVRAYRLSEHVNHDATYSISGDYPLFHPMPMP
jgi:hypothetical protein